MNSSAPTCSPAFLEIDPSLVAPILRDLDLDSGRVVTPRSRAEGGGEEARAAALLVGVPTTAATDRTLSEDLSRLLTGGGLEESGVLLLFLEGDRSARELATLRNRLWPLLHAGAVYRLSGGACRRHTLGGTTTVEGGASTEATVLAACRRAHALSPEMTIEKFDQNATGWNGEPGAPGYPHFRWMRRFVGCFAPIAPGARILDFGCGAGWCGIEAALRFRASELAFFDPSPEMIKIAERNAREAGVGVAHGRTGFGETPPFPAEGEAPFDAVISSGVISFSPDPERWLDGLLGTVAPGGTLVIGDIHHGSRGNRRRRAEKPLLPGRELNALTPGEVRARLEARGFEYREGAGYQLTRPFPEAMYVNETRLKGFLTWPLLWSNQLLASSNRRFGVPGQDQFDSWVMWLQRGGEVERG